MKCNFPFSFTKKLKIKTKNKTKKKKKNKNKKRKQKKNLKNFDTWIIYDMIKLQIMYCCLLKITNINGQDFQQSFFENLKSGS